MSQTGFTPILIYGSTTTGNTPSASNLTTSSNGVEIAINATDGKLFYKDNGGTVQVLATKGTGSIGGSNTQVQYNSSGALAGSANFTFNGTTVTMANDASIHGLTVGQGGGTVATNTAVGASALNASASGTNNSGFGSTALYSLTIGSNNTGLGSQALYTNTSGSSNTGVGQAALYGNNGSANTAIGYQSLVSNTSASNNTAVGYQALYSNTTSANSTAVGYQALYSNTTSANSTVVGYQAGYSIQTTNYIDALGYQAGYSVTGRNNICIGTLSGASLSSGIQNIFFGQASTASSGGVNNVIAIGYGITDKGTATGFISPGGGGVYQGNNSASWSTTSDQRLKKNIVDNTVGLTAINQIQVRNFEYRLPEEVTELEQHCAVNITGVQLGVIAQELQAVLPDCVKEESTGVLSVDTSNITWHLINAVKELSAQVTAQVTEIQLLKSKLGV